MTLARFIMTRSLSIAAALIITSASVAQASQSEDDRRFSQMRVAFEKGAFTEAQRIGEQLLSEKRLSPQLFHLLGNTRYRQNDLGRAAVWYQRASLFPPPAAETRQNLSHIHDRTGNFMFPANSLREQFASWLSRSQWLGIAAVCGWMMAFSIVIGLVLSYPGNFRVLCLTLAALATVCAGLCTLGWWWHPSYETVRDIAVVTESGAQAYTAATTTSGTVVKLPPGSQVRLIDDRDAWCYVEVHTGNTDHRGWVQHSALTPLWPKDFDPGYLE